MADLTAEELEELRGTFIADAEEREAWLKDATSIHSGYDPEIGDDITASQVGLEVAQHVLRLIAEHARQAAELKAHALLVAELETLLVSRAGTHASDGVIRDALWRLRQRIDAARLEAKG